MRLCFVVQARAGIDWSLPIASLRSVSLATVGFRVRSPKELAIDFSPACLKPCSCILEKCPPCVRCVLYSANVDYACIHLAGQWKRARKLLETQPPRMSWCTMAHKFTLAPKTAETMGMAGKCSVALTQVPWSQPHLWKIGTDPSGPCCVTARATPTLIPFVPIVDILGVTMIICFGSARR